MASDATTPLTIAVPKGRVMDKAIAMLRDAGVDISISGNSRAMRHESPSATVIEMRNADVPTFVELGVADVGIVGKDVLLEANRNVYEPVDLHFAHCRMSLIRPRGATQPIGRIASKFPNCAKRFAEGKGWNVEVIKLSGNVELACITGLADAVVDIVETGRTLEANQLEEIELVFHASARFIVNRAALKTKIQRIRPIIENLRKLAEP